MHCTPSARLEAQMPNEDTAYTREGTIAHSISEWLLTFYRDSHATAVPELEETKHEILRRMPQELMSLAEDCEAEHLHFWEVAETVHEGYVRPVFEDYLAAKAQDPEAVLLIEERLKLSEYIPEGFGSSDSIIIWGHTVQVNDLKYGKGVKVDAEENAQMMCYALGALCGPCELYDIEDVRMTILQPRLNHISTYEMTARDLLLWAGDVLKPAAALAFKGEGAYTPGDHCHFCKAAPVCKALKAKAELAVTQYEQPETLTPEQLGEALRLTESVKSWAKSVEDYALKIALDGQKVPGFKIVEGRSLRTIKDQAGAIEALKAAGFEPADVCKPQELRTISELEKLLRKAAFNSILGAFVVKPQGKPTLAPEADPRPVFNKAEDDFKGFDV